VYGLLLTHGHDNIQCKESYKTATRHVYTSLGGDGNLNLNTRLQADRCLESGRQENIKYNHTCFTHDLLDDLAGGVEVDETLVNFEFVTVPGL
jgi:hypothetical protein